MTSFRPFRLLSVAVRIEIKVNYSKYLLQNVLPDERCILEQQQAQNIAGGHTNASVFQRLSSMSIISKQTKTYSQGYEQEHR